MPGMNLVVDKAGAELELASGGVLVLREPGRNTTRVGIRALSNVVLHGEVKLTTSVLRAMAEAGVALTAVPARGRNPSCVFTVSSRRLAQLRHAQHLNYADMRARLELARMVVRAKLQGQQATLAAWGSAADLSLFVRLVDGAGNIDELMGIEGAAARAYFGAFSAGFPLPWKFPGRDRQPPSDPVNAMMSLGYTLALAECERYALRFGLDGSIGFLHSIAHERSSLALDLLEPVRPVVDRWIALLCQGGNLTPDHFTFSETEGCRLGKEGREIYYRAWFAQAVPTIARPLRRLVASLVSRLRASAQEDYRSASIGNLPSTGKIS